MKTITSLFIFLGMSMTMIYGQQKEDVYIFRFPGKFVSCYSMVFVVVEKDSNWAKIITHDIRFSEKNKKIKWIRKRFNPTERYKYEKLENGNIWVKYTDSEIRTSIDPDYYTTENFKKTEQYVYFKKYLPELAEMDNYEMLKYLDENFTKYYGPEEYRNESPLKKQYFYV